MSDPYMVQPGSSSFDGADAWEAYLDWCEEREIVCEVCGGDGGWDTTYIRSDHSEGNRHTPCTLCDGHGYRIEGFWQIELEDLDEMCGDSP